jgi:RNA polymerase sigma-70 factor (ECF subfamily)
MVSSTFRLAHAGNRVGAAAPPALAVSVDAAALSDDLDVVFEHAYHASFAKVYAFVRCQVAGIEIAQELVGRVFLKVYRHRAKIPQSSAASAQWIFRIAHTTLIDYWRVERRREAVNLPLDEIGELRAASDTPEMAYERRQRAVHIIRVMNTLPERDRTMLALKFSAHRTNREIAGILNVSEGAVSMRLLRALRRLREGLQELGWR